LRHLEVTMSIPARTRLDAWLPALLLFLGSAAFVGGGSRHPHVNGGTMGPPGSDEFFRHFAAMILNMPDWELFHTLILVGPVLWALAAGGTVRLLPARAASFGDVGRAALLMGAALWAVAFVLDGYVGPRFAKAVSLAGLGSDAAAIATFGANAFTMARIGMISVVLIGAAAFAFGAALLFDARIRSWRAAVGATGLLVGAWPALAALGGEFYPGPFTSAYWTPTAISLGLWFLLLGTVLPRLHTPAKAEDPG
jgi:hypothetical protein